MAEVAVSQFQWTVSEPITVTKDARVFETWKHEERWQILDSEKGQDIEGAVPCLFDEDGNGTLAVTQYSAKRIWIGPCNQDDTLFTMAHEVGHLVGAMDRREGVMNGYEVNTIEPSQATIDELAELYY